MRLLDIDFGPVLDAAGARGFFGEGYSYHRHLKRVGLDFSGSTLVTKTATLTGKAGYLLYGTDGTTPLELFPDCIVVKPRQGVVLNATGLGNPGIMKLLSDGRWQDYPQPFFISVMPVFGQAEWRLQEMVDLARIIAARRQEFQSPFGLQINLSCPTAGIETCGLIHEAENLLSIIGHLLPGVPLMPKFSVETPPEAVVSITEHRNCQAVCISNTVHWGALPDRINWRKLFGRERSPLELYGGGGLSGAPLLPLVAEWVMKARGLGLTKPINAGGGILSVSGAQAMFESGADSIFLGTVAMLRPWRVKKIISAVHSWQ